MRKNLTREFRVVSTCTVVKHIPELHRKCAIDPLIRVRWEGLNLGTRLRLQVCSCTDFTVTLAALKGYGKLPDQVA